MKRVTLLCGILVAIMLVPTPVQAGVADSKGICGGKDQISCFGICGSGLTLEPVYPWYCRECGGVGQWMCANVILGEFGCDYPLVLADNLKCYTSCDGEGEPNCFPLTCPAWQTIDFATLSCVACGDDGQLECLNFAAGTIGCKPWHTGRPPDFLFCTPCGGDGDWVCLNPPQNNYGCRPGHTLDPLPPDPLLRCTECGGEGQFMCINPLQGDLPCNKPWLRLPWHWPWDDGFTWPWEDAFTWPWEPGFCWPWQSCWVWPWEAALNLVTCTRAWDPIPEPDCDVFDESGYLDCDAEEQPEGEPLFGIADTHAHPFSNLAFGGALLWGSPFDKYGRGINYALPWGDYTWEFATTWTGDSVVDHFRDLLVQELPGLDYLLPDALNLPTLPTPNGYMIHAAPMAVFMAAVNEEDGWHSPSGPPTFANWPHWDSTMHQQQYYKWMQRAYKGGLRLMVMLAVNNEVSCSLSLSVREGYGCNDMDAVDRQLQATEDLETFIDNQYGGAGQGWFRIVRTPEEAREAIQSGKMAVVLGIEVDALFDCYPDNPECTTTHIRYHLEHYYNRGVRHVFPVHLHDNAFGGAALYHWLWPWANVIATGNHMVLVPCGELPEQSAQKYDYVPLQESGDPPSGFPQFVQSVIDELNALAGLVFPDIPGQPEITGWCNARPLMPKGEFLIREMMDRKLIIDVDHMSLATLNMVLDMAEDNDDYPLISGHSFLFDEPLTEFGTVGSRTENHRTAAQIERFRNLGGIVSPLPPRKEGSSTHDYAKMYEYIKEKMKGGPYGDDHPGIAFGSDWGAMFLMTAPRCPNYNPNDTDPGPEQCNEFHGERQPPLTYPFTIEGVPGEFDRQVTGTRTFDYNTDGLAHIGLFPDFIADVKIAGSTTDRDLDLQPLFNSAETYIRMWEKIEYCTPDNDPPEPDVDPLPTVTGVCSAEVTTIPTATDPYYCTGTEPIYGTTNEPLVYTEQGTHTIIWSYDDINGNTRMQTQTVIVEDTIPPELTIPDDVTIECDESTDPSNTGQATATDNCDPTPEVNYFNGTEPGACPQEYVLTRTWAGIDIAGNYTHADQIITVVDTTGPDVVCPPDLAVVMGDETDPAYTGWATATDACGAAQVTGYWDVEGPPEQICPVLNVITRTWSGIDECDNTSSCDQIIEEWDIDSDGDGVEDCRDLCPGVDDAVFAPGCVGKIPTVSQWGLVIMTLMFMTAGKIYFGRRRSAAV
ncbi:MAG: membrane dipeptidase [Phycisphaerales bacterium]|nr:MAG: membrane dipeptidase [Phycisphaerales bacterium]